MSYTETYSRALEFLGARSINVRPGQKTEVNRSEKDDRGQYITETTINMIVPEGALMRLEELLATQ